MNVILAKAGILFIVISSAVEKSFKLGTHQPQIKP